MDILKDLEKRGYDVSLGLYQLRNYKNYKDVIPLLMVYLKGLSEENMSEKKML